MSTRPMRRSMAGKQVLVIEDDSAIAEMIIMLLEGEGYQVTWADTAAAIEVLCPYAGVANLEGPAILSLQAAMEARPDVILLDLLLPGRMA